MMKFRSPALPAALLAGTLLAGCSNETAKQHNATLDSAAQLFHAPQLANETVRTITDYTSGQATNETQNHIIDVTGTVNTHTVERFKKAQEAAVRIIGAQLMTTVHVVRPDGTEQSVTERTAALQRKQHTYIFVTPEQLSHDSSGSLPASVTFNQAAESQTSSLIVLDEKANKRLSAVPLSLINTATEICQSEVQMETKGPVDEGTQSVLQEAFCNGLGRAMAARQSGVPYQEYVAAFGSSRINAKNYVTDQYFADATTYTALPE